MNSKAYRDWLRVGWDVCALSIEASAVIGLRFAKLATGGDAATREAELMVTEKMRAGFDLLPMMIGRTPTAGARAALRYYRGRVAANRRRLAR